MNHNMIVGGIELGGTKTIAAIGAGDGTLIESARFATTAPEQLIPQVCDYMQARAREIGTIAGVGVGAFGPIVVDRKSAQFGHLLGTNKPGWSGFDLAGAIVQRLGVPMSLVTDVGAAGIGEARLGNLRGVDLGIYLTVGTGIGGAVLHNGMPLPALLHPELGHLSLVRQPGDLFPSTCAFHPNCAEGLAAGPAVQARFGQPLSAFRSGGPEHALVADYVGQLLASLQLAISPQRIVIGGGVSQAAGLLDLIRGAMRRHVGSYIDCDMDDPAFLAPPRLGGEAGVIGALVAGANAASESEETRRRSA